MKTSLTDFDWFRDMVMDIDKYQDLNDWELEFISAIEKKIKERTPLTEKQADKLVQLWERSYK